MMGKGDGACSTRMRYNECAYHPEHYCGGVSATSNTNDDYDDEPLSSTPKEAVETTKDDIFEVSYLEHYTPLGRSKDTLHTNLMTAEKLIELIKSGKLRSAINKGKLK